jgi:hypothetical protein
MSMVISVSHAQSVGDFLRSPERGAQIFNSDVINARQETHTD